MKRIVLIVIGLLVVLGVVAELAVIPLAEAQMEKQVAARSDGAAGVSSDIDSFPLITSVLLTGKVRKLSVTLEEVAGQQLQYSDVRFDVSGIEVDRAAILQRKVKINSIDEGKVTATIQLGSLGSALGRIGSLIGDRFGIGGDGDGGLGGVSVEDGQLQVGSTSFPISTDLFPCDPSADLDGEVLTLTCTLDEVPDVLLDAAQTSF